MRFGFSIGDGFAAYRGAVGDSAVHRHAAFQIAIAQRGEVAVADAAGTVVRAPAVVVPPMVRHRLLAAPDLRTFFVDPHCVFADSLRQRYRSIAAFAPRALRLDDIAVQPSGELDPRLLTAMHLLRDASVAMPALAAAVGLSPQRLRALALEQLGLPLARWRVWSRLRRAAEALGAGRTPAAAAVEAGFADQAHLTRQMREMMGLTPAVVLPVLRP
ncbi:helix-turn-helix domain-containing protein [Dactylosporangium sp. CS-033363]|uniref:helix-turn-helix domain-containing protein n=1 Tax=Dactylosporangium sp. CS-033363 TaxID=3239935 RepID=UPI003D8B24E8